MILDNTKVLSNTLWLYRLKKSTKAELIDMKTWETQKGTSVFGLISKNLDESEPYNSVFIAVHSLQTAAGKIQRCFSTFKKILGETWGISVM